MNQVKKCMFVFKWYIQINLDLETKIIYSVDLNLSFNLRDMENNMLQTAHLCSSTTHSFGYISRWPECRFSMTPSRNSSDETFSAEILGVNSLVILNLSHQMHMGS